MRISDWSSDVCSSDLSVSTDTHFSHKAWHDTSDAIGKIKYPMIGDPTHEISSNFEILRPTGLADRGTFIVDPQGVIQAIEITAEGIGRDALELLRKVKAAQYVAAHPGEVRSEEHTSELQSLMRISYAVFCLKKKNINGGKHR